MLRERVWRPSPSAAAAAVLFTVAVLSSGGCGDVAGEADGEGVRTYGVKLPSGYIFLMEDPGHPALKKLRRAEGIDELPGMGDGSAHDDLTALAGWAAEQFDSSLPYPNYPPWNAGRTLAMIRAGETGGFCAQYAIVFGQAAQSLGYAVRYVDLMSEDRTEAHFITEVFLPDRRMWAAFEPQFGYGYVDGGGEPLGVLALHEYSRGLRAGEVFAAPHGTGVDPRRLSLFHHFRVHLRNNFLTVPVRHRVRRVPEGLQWLFEPYRLAWAGEVEEGYVPVPLETVRPEDFQLPLDSWEDALPAKAETAREVISRFAKAPVGRLYVFSLPLAEAERLVDRFFIADEAFRPLGATPRKKAGQSSAE